MNRKKIDLRFQAAVVLILLELILIILIRKYTNSTLLFEQIWISTAFSFAILQIGNKLKGLRLDLVYLVLIAVVSGSLLSHTLLNIDRSRSFYVLSWIDEGNLEILDGKITLKQKVSSEMDNLEALELRIHEAESRGLATVPPTGQAKLTFLGKALVETSELIASVFELNMWRSETR
jgi:hypothetical protein